MRFARKLFVLAVMVLATMAFGASSASAVEIETEPGEVHCDPVTLMAHHEVEGGCLIRAENEDGQETIVQGFVAGVGFVTISTCEDQFEAAIGEDGTGYLYEAITNSMETGDPCLRTMCDEASNGETPHALIPWQLSVLSTSKMEIQFCLRPLTTEGAAGTTCMTQVDIVNVDHAYEFRATGGVQSGSCANLGGGARVIGHWDVIVDEAHPAIEILP